MTAQNAVVKMLPRRFSSNYYFGGATMLRQLTPWENDWLFDPDLLDSDGLEEGGDEQDEADAEDSNQREYMIFPL